MAVVLKLLLKNLFVFSSDFRRKLDFRLWDRNFFWLSNPIHRVLKKPVTNRVKLYKSPRSSVYFEPAKNCEKIRSDQNLLVHEKLSNTRRCKNAPHNYLARLVNQNKTRILKKKQWFPYLFVQLLIVDNRSCVQLSVLLW